MKKKDRDGGGGGKKNVNVWQTIIVPKGIIIKGVGVVSSKESLITAVFIEYKILFVAIKLREQTILLGTQLRRPIYVDINCHHLSQSSISFKIGCDKKCVFPVPC